MMWAFIVILVLLIPVLSIVLDSQLGRALAARIERRSLAGADDLLADRIAFLEGEVERLSSEVRRLDDEGQFLQRLLTEGSEEGGALPPASPSKAPPAARPAVTRSDRGD
jgi:hypothetical protein